MPIIRLKREDLAPLTQEREAELKALSKISDDEIDYSDIPKLSTVFSELKPLISNEETLQAIKEARAGITKRFDSIDDLMSDLNTSR